MKGEVRIKSHNGNVISKITNRNFQDMFVSVSISNSQIKKLHRELERYMLDNNIYEFPYLGNRGRRSRRK